MKNGWAKLALGVWGLVGAAWGLTFGIYFGANVREVAFLVALGVGIVLIMWLNAPRRKVKAKVISEAPPLQISAGKERQVAGVKADDLMREVTQNLDRRMSASEAREWLDKFLVKQQEK